MTSTLIHIKVPFIHPSTTCRCLCTSNDSYNDTRCPTMTRFHFADLNALSPYIPRLSQSFVPVPVSRKGRYRALSSHVHDLRNQTSCGTNLVKLSYQKALFGAWKVVQQKHTSHFCPSFRRQPLLSWNHTIIHWGSSAYLSPSSWIKFAPMKTRGHLQAALIASSVFVHLVVATVVRATNGTNSTSHNLADCINYSIGESITIWPVIILKCPTGFTNCCD